MHEVIIGKSKRQLPSSFSELTPDQANKIGPLLFSSIPEDQKKVSILFLLLNISKDIFNKIPQDIISNELYKLIDFLFAAPESICLVKEFEIEGVTYLCPAPGMEYSSYIEFAMASTLMENIDPANCDLDSFNEIIATLCRPHRKDNVFEWHPDFNGDFREKYNAYSIARRVEIFKKLEPWKKIAIIRFFNAIQAEIRKPDKYGLIFNTSKLKKDGVEVVPEKAAASNDIVPGWIGYLYEVSGGKFGTFEQTAHTNMHTVLIHICREINKAKRS
jgi:hypothetical protein